MSTIAPAPLLTTASGVLFTGDTILGASSTTVNDLGAYLDSLAGLRDLPNLQVMCPGHGPVISNPVKYIDDYVRGRNERERQILELLGQKPELTTWEIMETIYAGRDLVR